MTVHLHANEQVSVAVDGVSAVLGPHAISVLDAFARPATFADAISRLQERAVGVQDWVDLTTTVQQLYELGALHQDGEPGEPSRLRRFGFDDPRIHVKMLNDRMRTQAFLTAIEEVVQEGDVVVDLGTGTGVLAMAAARAGARRVYAIEAGGIGAAARALFESNGLDDRVTLVEGWSSRVAPPEPADVLVTETIGNDPLGEQVLELARDARQRLLRPGARIIPSCVRVLVLPVTVPPDVLADQSFTADGAARWRDWYGFDFQPLLAANPHFAFVRPATARGWGTFADPLSVGEIDLAEVVGLKIDGRAEFAATRSGSLNGLVVFFELQLSEATVFSLHPNDVDDHSSWRYPVWVLPEPIDAAVGERFSVSYTYRAWPEARLSINRV